MEEELHSSAAAIAVDKVDRGIDFITVRPAQELAEGILPIAGGDENRKITISSCCLVSGHVFGREVILLDCDKRTLSTRAGELLPGTQVNGGINAFENVYVGSGAVIRGGILCAGNVTVADAVSSSAEIPSRVIIQGSVCGADVELGDGVVVLGPVIAQNSLKIGNGVTIRDYAISPHVEIGDGCLLGGLIAAKSVKIGDLNTVASSKIVLPADRSAWDIRSDIRSPYPGCNNCPHKARFGGDASNVDFGRLLSCHLFSNLSPHASGGLSATMGECRAWTAFPINDEEQHWLFSDNQAIGGEDIQFRVVSNVGKNSLNMDQDAMHTAIWELTAES